jgi:flavin-dependent dehydrogenase
VWLGQGIFFGAESKMTEKTEKTIVVGSGVGGILAGWKLSEQGMQVQVFPSINQLEDMEFTPGFFSKNTEKLAGLEEIAGLQENLKTAEISNKNFFVCSPVGEKKVYIPAGVELSFISTRELSNCLLSQGKKAGMKVGRSWASINLVTDEKKIVLDGQDVSYGENGNLVISDGRNHELRKAAGMKSDFLHQLSWIIPQKIGECGFFIDWEKFGMGIGFVFPKKDSTLAGIWWYNESYIPLEIKEENFVNLFESRYSIDLMGCRKRKLSFNSGYPAKKVDGIYYTDDAGGFSNSIYGEDLYLSLQSGKSISKKISEGASRRELKKLDREMRRHTMATTALKLYEKIPKRMVAEFSPGAWRIMLVFMQSNLLVSAYTRAVLNEFRV